MIVTNNKRLARNAQELRNHAEITGEFKKNYKKNLIGYNHRLTEIQAAIGIEQLKKLNKIIKKKQLIAKKLSQFLIKFEGIVIPKIIIT